MQIERIPSPGHEQVLSCTDAESGLRAFIAVHDTTLGPALGGCRMWRYDSAEAALADVLRLSAGMTAKSALAGVPFGGGKAVIMGDPRTEKTPDLLRAFGRIVDTLHGAFITGEDVGMAPADMAVVATRTRHVVGLESGPCASGDPSPVTAEGVFHCMEAAARLHLGSRGVAGARVAVQGLGHVGLALVARLSAAGARVIAADTDMAANRCAADRFGAEIVPPDRLLDAEADILAPCALGGVLNREAVPRLRARLVCGSANNQLDGRSCARALHERGILYCPDYVVNAGGLISVAREALGIADEGWIGEKLDRAVETFRTLIDRAHRERTPPLDIADAMVARILRAARMRALRGAAGAS